MPKTNATFIEPMMLLRTENLPQGDDWLYEIKLDGYRALAIKSGGRVQLRSRNDNDFTKRYSSIAAALCTVPDETVLDGELIALDEEGRPSFHLLQNYVSSKAALVFFIFDVLILRGRNVMTEPLSERRALLEKHVLPKLVEPIRCSPELKAGLPQLIASVKSSGLEGLVAHRTLAVTPGNLLHHHAMLGTLDPPRGVAIPGGDTPERHKLPAPFRQTVIARCRLLAQQQRPRIPRCGAIRISIKSGCPRRPCICTSSYTKPVKRCIRFRMVLICS